MEVRLLMEMSFEAGTDCADLDVTYAKGGKAVVLWMDETQADALLVSLKRQLGRVRDRAKLSDLELDDDEAGEDGVREGGGSAPAGAG